MARTIKFRAWLTDEDGPWMSPVFRLGQGDQWEFRAEHVMQFTGLKDKNGVEIYEGDLCSALAAVTIDLTHSNPLSTATRERFVGEVMLDPYRGVTIGSNGVTLLSDIEVIGNIYENWELADDYR